MRSFRLFAFDAYQGKSRSYIEDDIARRLAAYEAQSRKHGFKLTEAVINSVSDVSNLSLAPAGTLLSALTGEPIAALIGATLSVGKITVSLVRQSSEYGHISRSSEVAFLIDAKKRLG